MQELEKFGRVMEVIVDDCDKCPLEKICDSACYIVWQKFMRSKVKEDGLEECRN